MLLNEYKTHLAVFILFLLSVNVFGQNLTLTFDSESSNEIGLYEKYEVVFNISGERYSNPYDPDEIDLRATFISPTGIEYFVFGFYDNFNNTNKWKIRFSPNERGEWTYNASLVNAGDTAKSEGNKFIASESDNHGWLKISENNPHYFEHDDGTSFYGVGAFYPWGVNNNSNGLALLESSGANFFGYWNIMYGGEGRIIESMESGLGRYDQPKCGRIDQIIEWAEARNLKIMLSFWPHDLLAGPLLQNTGWATQWHQNPYNTITTAAEFYESEEAWEYQKKQYRYLIARFGYSRSLGIWEMVNEINGTDGWQAGKSKEILTWVKKVYQYFKENDTFQHPVTVSQSGGIYWPEGYAETDVSNVHLYETGWSAEFPGNPLRSSHFLYNKISNSFWNDFDKPGILGEAGYTNSYGNFATPSSSYTELYHNALYASWAGGLAITPVWWDFGSKSIMSNSVMQQMKSFSKISSLIEYNKSKFEIKESFGDEVDVYLMGNGELSFGWLREEKGQNPVGRIFDITGLPDTSYFVRWFDTWNGVEFTDGIGLGIEEKLSLTIPEPPYNKSDLAFIIQPIGEGGEPFQLSLTSSKSELLASGNASTEITCLLRDKDGLISKDSTRTVTFRIEGPGEIVGDTEAKGGKGYILSTYRAGIAAGEVKIIAESPGLISDTVLINLTDKIMLSDFEKYQNNNELFIDWQIRAGTEAALSLTQSWIGDGKKSLVYNYNIGNGSAPYSGFEFKLKDNYEDTENLTFWYKPDNSNRTLALLMFSGTDYWQYELVLEGDSPKYITIPFIQFVAQKDTSVFYITKIDRISFNVLKGDGDWGEGELYFDGFAFTLNGVTSYTESGRFINPEDFKLFQNYPNPFNPSTNIEYYIPNRSQVTIEVYDVLGRKVTTLFNGMQNSGKHTIVFNAGKLASGLYLVNLKSNDFFVTIKISLIK